MQVPNLQIENCYMRVNCNDSRVTLHTRVFKSLCVLSSYSSVLLKSQTRKFYTPK